MSVPQADTRDGFIWVTRGQTWGFRFLRDGGLSDPLTVYEATFSTVGDQREACRRIDDRVALRFPDPDERRDEAGRVITHDFVLTGWRAEQITSLEDGRHQVWDEVKEEYESIWNNPDPPLPAG
jgi:hypothetical protein